MINQKTYSFLIKFLILAFVFLCISIFVKSFIFEETDIEKNSSIPFLKIDNHLTDSIIALMTIDEKIDLLVRTNANESAKSIEEFELQKITEHDDSLSSKNETELEDNDKFEIITKHSYFNAISDTALIKNYLRKIKHENSSKNYLIELNDFDIESSSDSAFMEFYKQRYELYKEIIRENNSLFGLKLNLGQLELIDSLKRDSTYFLNDFYEEIGTKTDIILIDSFNNSERNLKSQGISAVIINNAEEYTSEKLLKLLNSSFDILFFKQEEIKRVKSLVKEIFEANQHDQEKLQLKLRKIVKAQIWQKHENRNLKPALISSQTTEHQIIEQSICLLNNPDSILPIKSIKGKKFTIAWIGNNTNSLFYNNIKKYASTQLLHLKLGESNWVKKIQYYQKRSFVIYVLDTLLTDTSELNQLNVLKENMLVKSSAFINVGYYQNLKYIPDSIACIQTQSNSTNEYKFTAQAIYGGISLEGMLPFNVTEPYSYGPKYNSPKTRLKYTIPEDAGLEAKILEKIDKIAWEGISRGAFPGCQVFVAKDGKVVYNKSFGYHTYSRKIRVKHDDVYDLASVTKIASTTIASMHMISNKKMSLNNRLGKFFRNTSIDYTRIKPDTVEKIDTFFISTIQNWPEFLAQNDTLNINDSSFITRDTIITKLTPKRNIFKVPLFDLLRHKSGIVPAMPIFRYMYYKAYFIKQLKDQLAEIHGKTGPMFNYKSYKLPFSFPDNTDLPDSLKQIIKKGFENQYNEYFSKNYIKDSSDIRLAKNLYFKNEYFDTVWRDTKQLPVFSRKVFQYSDVNMVLLQMAIDSLNNKSIDTYLKKAIYKQLGLKTITYLPLRYYGKHKIVPTEQDNSWRFGILHGFVHDPSAALLGGMAGNAGLYSNAHDLGVLFQMVLNKGNYGGKQYLKPEIIELFTKRYDDTQRALGFDMPNRKAIVGKKASKKTYGHSGYTGTCVWVDPDNQLVYVFLSNRNHPKSKNWRISKYQIRERIHDAIYDAFIKHNEISEEGINMLAEKNNSN